MARGIVGWIRAHDPDGTAGHKAVKVAGAVTIGMAIGTIVGKPQLSLFASFGGIALLVFADFPGNRTARLGAYAGLLVVGSVLIALGTLLSGSAASAVVGMAVIGFAVLLCGVLSAAMAGASRAALLTFILPVMVPAPASEIPSRLAGWALAAVLSVPLAVFVWPPPDHDRLRRTAAAACRALADRLAVWSSSADAAAIEGARVVAGAAVAELRTNFRRTNVRPVGLTTGSRQLMRLTDRLEWLRTVIDRLPPAQDRTAEQRTVTDACVAVLRSAATVLDQAPRRPSFASRQELSVQLRTLQQLHVATQAFARLVRTGPVPGPAVHPSTMLEVAYTTRLTGLTVATSAAADARPLIDRLLGRNPPAAATGQFLPVRKVLAGHLNLRSVWFQNSVRGALGLTIAVAIAQVTEVSHGFWVVLGAMSVLRTTALTTGSTALRALSGTVIGFVVGSVVMLVVGTTPWHLWLLLPIALLVAGYLPEAVSFTAGQAAFTVLVVVLFNIISPTGWQVGLVRVEDVLFGCASALVSGVLLWPHGAAAAIRTALAEYIRGAADAVVAATDRVTGATTTPDDLRSALAGAAIAALRLDDALREYMFERGTRNVPIEALTTLANGAGRIRMTAEAVAELSPATEPALAPAIEVMTVSAGATRDWFGRLADRLEHSGRRVAVAPLPAPPDPVAETTVVADTRAVLCRGGSPGVLGAGRTLWSAALYLDNLTWVQRRLVAPSAELSGVVADRPGDSTKRQSTSRA